MRRMASSSAVSWLSSAGCFVWAEPPSATVGTSGIGPRRGGGRSALIGRFFRFVMPRPLRPFGRPRKAIAFKRAYGQTRMDRTLHETLTGWRRYLHANPDLTLHEADTAAFVQEKLRQLGIPFIAKVGGHGVVATLTRGASNRSVGLRADMDALPIQETSGVPYASRKPGVMHACGHDGHTVSLLGAAAMLAADPSWLGTVHFVFQPAEEGGGGARSMIADGLFDRFPMERIFGYHNWPGLEAGTVAVHEGPVMAAGNRLYF